MGYVAEGTTQYAHYLLSRLYAPSATVAELLDLGAYVITETSRQDAKVGPYVALSTITASNGYQISDAAECRAVAERNRVRASAVRRLFVDSAPEHEPTVH
jgi:hypothetical protein